MNICQLTEKAIISFLSGAGLTLVSNLYRGIEGADTQASSAEETHRKLPCVIVDCAGATPEAIPSGNWIVIATIRVHSQSDDETETQHHARAQEVFGKIMTDTIAADLSAFAGYTAFLVIPQGQSEAVFMRHWESSLMMKISCVPSDIT